MKVGIVGAGNNADYHIRFSTAYTGVQIVGVADRDLPKAQELCQRYGIGSAFGSVTELLAQGKPDVVHVVTPPKTHFAVVREVLEAGCHAMVEKPLALNAQEAEELYAIAERRGVQICPVHNHLFDPCMREADALVKSGRLGQIINVESHYGLNTNIPAFRDYPQPNVLPWLYGLPGGVYQDFLPHALYVLLEYTGTPRSLTVKHKSTGTLPQGLPDEIRMLVDGEHAFGTVTVSFAAKPHLHYIRIFGTNGMVEVDINTMTTTLHAVSSLPKAAQKATYNLEDSWQKTTRTFTNTWQFLTGKLKPYQGMRTLIHQFYDAVKTGAAPPVSKQSALGVVRTMDAVFDQLRYEPLKHETIVPVRAAHAQGRRVLVTGGTGFVGKVLVRRLLADGYRVRVLARKLARVDALVEAGAEVFWGDVADPVSFGQAFEGCDLIVHLAAGTSGSEKDSETATLQGTRNLLDLCRQRKPERLVYISSCSVYGVADYERNTRVAESASLERFPERRGAYSASKQQAETYVSEYAKAENGQVAILRPGTVYGPGGDLYTPMMGFSMGSLYVVIGTGSFVLPFVQVDNLAEAIVRSIEKPEAAGEVFNVVDPETITKREYVDRVIRRVDAGAKVLYLPYSVLYGITWLQEVAFGLMKRRPVLTRYRLESSQKSIVYDSSRIARAIGWRPSVSKSDALERLVAFETSTAAGQATAAGLTPDATAPIARAVEAHSSARP